MSVPDDLERDLERALAGPLPSGRLASLDGRIARMAAAAPAVTPGRGRSAWAAVGTLATTALVVVLAVVVVLNGPVVPAVPGGPPVAPGTTGPDTGESLPPAPTAYPSSTAVALPSPTTTPSPPATPPTRTPRPSPSREPTPEPTTRPTREPTPRPPKPTPEPEPTDRVFSGSGRLGDPLTVHGVTVTMRRTDVPEGLRDECSRFDRETWAYTFRMAWEQPKGNVEPWVGVGANPHNTVYWEPRFAVDRDLVVVVCHRPEDGDRVFVQSSPDGTPTTYYEWRFNP